MHHYAHMRSTAVTRRQLNSDGGRSPEHNLIYNRDLSDNEQRNEPQAAAPTNYAARLPKNNNYIKF